ncbi:hypothetical protein GTY89_23695 [Streptomyces sp. SID5471]|nr:hypothetical protein [Streptomyces sp. SID5471]QDA03417.1 hypothetical protein CTZ40_06345 [Streptomyces rimosus]QEV74695.1 hypothetical protein CP984_06335 [Streptomyces rimosus]QGY68327.1 hypothetical protein V519_022535 [Streptomyces rimosus R6-500]QTL85500.1 hypothetical protein FMM49_06880 [Streptomyces rimosus subsp. rimosus]
MFLARRLRHADHCAGGRGGAPPRPDDPGTDGRRYASGCIGLQVHGASDVISYRDIRVKEL